MGVSKIVLVSFLLALRLQATESSLFLNCESAVVSAASPRLFFGEESSVSVSADPILSKEEEVSLAIKLMNPAVEYHQAYLRQATSARKDGFLYIDDVAGTAVHDRVMAHVEHLMKQFNSRLDASGELFVWGGVLRAMMGNDGFVIPDFHDHKKMRHGFTYVQRILGPQVDFEEFEILTPGVLFGSAVRHRTPPGNGLRLFLLLVIGRR